jgi:hypothetical protein
MSSWRQKADEMFPELISRFALLAKNGAANNRRRFRWSFSKKLLQSGALATI